MRSSQSESGRGFSRNCPFALSDQGVAGQRRGPVFGLFASYKSLPLQWGFPRFPSADAEDGDDCFHPPPHQVGTFCGSELKDHVFSRSCDRPKRKHTPATNRIAHTHAHTTTIAGATSPEHSHTAANLARTHVPTRAHTYTLYRILYTRTHTSARSPLRCFFCPDGHHFLGHGSRIGLGCAVRVCGFFLVVIFHRRRGFTCAQYTFRGWGGDE